MSLDDLRAIPREKRTPLEQCILDSQDLEDMRDGEYTIQELALSELEHIRTKQFDGVSLYDIANAAVDELFTAGDNYQAHRLELKDVNEGGHGGWAKIPARDIIVKHIRAAFTSAKNGGR